MQLSQQLNKTKFFLKATPKQRAAARIVFGCVFGVWAVLWLASKGKIDLGFWLGICGFKQRYGLPCPTCGMTTAAIAFVSGKILESFWIQPAGAILCSVAAVSAFLALFIMLFGVYFSFLRRFFAGIKVGYIIWALVIIITVGWIFTFIRALSANN
jgi:hypothetical protein